MGCIAGKSTQVEELVTFQHTASGDEDADANSQGSGEHFRPSYSSGTAGTGSTASGAPQKEGKAHAGHRPKRVVLIRHGESEANVNRKITQGVPDHALHLTAKGREQALDTGERLLRITQRESTQFMISPYVRTRETFNGIARAFGDTGLHVREDVQMREQDFGNFDKPDVKELHKEKRVFGQFYYRFPEGESLADVYDRASLFLESLYRQWEHSQEENFVLVSHGLWIHIFLMRLFGYGVDQFYHLESLHNCEIIVLQLDPATQLYEIAFTWSPGQEKQYDGMRKIKSDSKKKPNGLRTEIWDGDPAKELIVSKTYTTKTRSLMRSFASDRSTAPADRSSEPHAATSRLASLTGLTRSCTKY